MLDLPREIIQLVVRDFLPAKHDRLSLILSCRTYYDQLLPTLYLTPSLRPNLQAQRNLFCSFVESILRKPVLAQAVQKLELHRWDTLPTAHGDTIECIPELYDAIKTCSHSLEEQEQWLSDVKAGKPDSWLALMLPRLHNLHALWIIFPPATKCPKYITKMLARAAAKEPPFDVEPAFPSLTEVYVTSADINGLSPVLVLPCFAFPSLRKFCVGERYGFLKPPEHRKALAPSPDCRATSNLTALDLRSIGQYKDLHKMIERCKELKYFHLTRRSFRDRENRNPVVSLGHPSSLLPFLEMHKSCLESVLIDVHDKDALTNYQQSDYERSCGTPQDRPDDGWARGQRGFGDFVALRFLHILLPLLVQPPLHLRDCLPRSIEELHLVAVYNDILPMIVSQLQDLAADREQYIPNLHRLVLIGNLGADSSQSLQELCIAFEQAGIELMFLHRQDRKFFAPTWEQFGMQHDPRRARG